MRRHNQKGQALVFVALALGIFVIGSLGLAIDGGQLYLHRQMAQAAADAAAQAAIMSMFNGTNTSGATQFVTSDFTCTTAATSTPCDYARRNGFGAAATDTVSFTFPSTVPGVWLWGATGPGVSSPGMVVRANVTRQVPTTLMRMLGAANFTTVGATATAALVGTLSPVPLVITHPTMAGALNLGGSGNGHKIIICGGPDKSIQINSNSTAALTWNGGPTIDLSRAGPDDPGDCSSGTGGDFGTFGGPATAYSGISLGSSGLYIQPASPIRDPLESVPVPAQPSAAPVPSPINPGVHGCTATGTGKCMLYRPGSYAAGITVKGENAVFAPGLYYMRAKGFNLETGSIATMATGFGDDAATRQGMVVFNTGLLGDDIFKIVANAGSTGAGITLVGAPNDSIYKGILFFQDPTAAGGTHKVSTTQMPAHSIQGGGTWSLTGTIYINRRGASGSDYQQLTLGGNGGSSTTLVGQIITNALDLGGTPGIRMRLNPAAVLRVRQIAMVQ
jgi:Flp pilus assembly protein TadG